MKRMIAMVVMAGLAVACSDQNKQSADRAASAAQQMGDSALAVGKSALDSAKVAGREMVDSVKSKGGAMIDSAQSVASGATDSAKAAGQRLVDSTKTTASAGQLALSNSLTSLTKDQVRQLQAALTNDGCDAGAADGVVGKKTRDAMACSMQKHDIAAGDVKGLYQTLGLDF